MLHIFWRQKNNGRMKKFGLILVINLLLTSNCFAVEILMSPDVWPCYDLEMIYARGSGGALGDTDELRAIETAAAKITENYRLSVFVYDLPYPAVDISSIKRLIGAYVSAGKAYEFGDSVREGVANLKAHFAEQHRNCPDMHFAFVGYSQGAMVVSQAVPDFDAEYVDFIMLLGDPNTYLPEGDGMAPLACSGGALSPWRTYVPNCRTNAGVFGARKPYESPGLTGKYSLWCNRDDYICGSSKNPLNNGGHTEYASSGEITWGIAKLAKKYLYMKGGGTEMPIFSTIAFSEDSFDDLVDDPPSAGPAVPEGVAVWRDGEILRLKWHSPENVKYLMLRFNGIDLGYVDAALGEFAIWDVDFSRDYNLQVAWMGADGDLGESLEIADDDVSDTAPEWVEDAALPDEPAPPQRASPLPSASEEEKATALPVEDVPMVDITRSGGAGLAQKTGMVKVVFGVLVASGLLGILFLKRRH